MPSERTPPDQGSADRSAYRALAWHQREGEPQYADAIGDVLGDPLLVRQWADDLSGRYGPYTVRFLGERSGHGVCLKGRIYDGDAEVGVVRRRFARCVESHEIIVHHERQELVIPAARRHGFGSALWDAMEPYYRRSGAGRIELIAALEDGSCVWAKAGYQWDRTPERLEASLDSVRTAAEQVRNDPGLSEYDRGLLGALIDSLHPEVDDVPSPAHIVHLTTDATPNLGEMVMRQANWYGVLYL